MPLQDILEGQTIARYRIGKRIGSGGMGIVYRARDTRLERDVALKALPQGILADEDSRRRFRREVLLLAELSHPNIATVYDFDQYGDILFLVMEFVRGITLSERMRSGPIARGEALPIALQIASALEAAHEHGVVHRDLKPGNIMVTSRGLVKVLDFGLAFRTVHAAPNPTQKPGSDSPEWPTQSAITRAGQAMGTPGYMSPEQIRAEPLDARTDVFSFGCVLYECLTGKRAFPGATLDAVQRAVLTRRPSWSALPRRTAPPVLRVLRGCLERDLAGRLRTMGEVRQLLSEAVGERGSTGARSPALQGEGFPQHRTSLIGRTKDLVVCRDELRRTRLLTLAGPGGIGKTRLAIQLAQGLLVECQDGATFLDLSPLTDSSRVTHAVASALGIREAPGTPLIDQVIQALRSGNRLVVLDNCEQVIEGAASWVARVQADCPRLQILATSREPLRVAGERVHRVPPLSVPPDGQGSTAALCMEYEAVQLFCDRAGRANSDFELTDSNAAAVSEITRRLDGLPLALELAAARARFLTVDEIRSKLDQRFHLLSGGDRSAPSRHQTLRGAIAWSHDLLDSEERALFRKLAVFAGGWTLEAAATVCDRAEREFEVLDQMGNLIDKSLVIMDQTRSGPTRYRFLESVREFALEELQASPDLEAVQERHRSWFASVAEEAEPNLLGRNQGDWMARLEADHENLLAAIRGFLREPPEPERALRVVGAIWRFWYSRGHFQIGRAVLKEVLDQSGAETRDRARALRGAGVLAYYQGDYESSRELLERSLSISRSVRDPLGIARGLNALAGIAMDVEDYDRADPMYRESLTISREIHDRGGEAVCLGNLAATAKFRGKDSEALPLYLECLEIMREVGDRGNEANLLFDLGALFTRIGRTGEAAERLTECLELVRALGEKRTGAYALEGTGDFLAHRGRWEEASRLYGAAASLRVLIGAPLTPVEEQERARRASEAERELGTAACAAGVDQGRAMPFGRAIEHALHALASSGRERQSARTPSRARFTESTAHLLAHAQRGDLGAADQLAKRYRPILRRWARGRIPEQERGFMDTDDLVQVTLARGFARLTRFEHRGEGAFLAYLLQILRNRIRDELRRTARSPKRVPLLENVLDQAPSPLTAAIGQERIDRYRQRLSALPARQREAVLLRYEMGWPYRRIADAVGSPTANSARMLIGRALGRLRNERRARRGRKERKTHGPASGS